MEEMCCLLYCLFLCVGLQPLTNCSVQIMGSSFFRARHSSFNGSYKTIFNVVVAPSDGRNLVLFFVCMFPVEMRGLS